MVMMKSWSAGRQEFSKMAFSRHTVKDREIDWEREEEEEEEGNESLSFFFWPELCGLRRPKSSTLLLRPKCNSITTRVRALCHRSRPRASYKHTHTHTHEFFRDSPALKGGPLAVAGKIVPRHTHVQTTFLFFSDATKRRHFFFFSGWIIFFLICQRVVINEILLSQSICFVQCFFKNEFEEIFFCLTIRDFLKLLKRELTNAKCLNWIVILPLKTHFANHFKKREREMWN